MRKVIFICLIVLLVLLSGCLATDPVRQAQASAIRTQADMDVARQSATLAQAQLLAQAQAQAAIINAQAAADATAIKARSDAETSTLWVTVVTGLIGLVIMATSAIIALMITSARHQARLLGDEIIMPRIASRDVRYKMLGDEEIR